MKDFSNYHQTDMAEKINHDGNLLLEGALIGAGSSAVKINGIETRAVITKKYNSNGGNNQNIIGRQSEIIRGNLVEYQNEKWLITSLPSDNDVYRKAIITVCNNTLFLKNEPVKTQTGTDRFGRPEYDYVYPPDTPLPCIADNSITTNESDQPIRLPNNQLQITIPYTEHPDIKEGKKFQMYGREYEINGIDETESIDKVGLMIIRAGRE